MSQAPFLDEKELDLNPLKQFEAWFQDAQSNGLPMPEAFVLATVSAEGRPSTRTMLYKGQSEGGFRFVTNYNSLKGRELEANPYAEMLFFWMGEPQRQIRIRGRVEKVSEKESLEYFRSRDRGSQVGAWASDQGQVLQSREELENKVKQVEEKYAQSEIPRPPHWGAYRLLPESYEFWQSQIHRLHDRFHYEQDSSEKWTVSRLSP